MERRARRNWLVAGAVIGAGLLLWLVLSALRDAPRSADRDTAASGAVVPSEAARPRDSSADDATPACRWRGSVVDVDGRPRADAQVFASDRPDADDAIWEIVPLTESAGFCVRDHADVIGLFAQAVGRAASPVTIRNAADPSEIVLRLRELGSAVEIRGEVNDQLGGAIEDAIVVVRDGKRRAAARTDGDGAFVLHAAPGRVVVTASHPSYWGASQVRLLAPSESVRVDFRLMPASSIAGRVVLADATPAPSARVAITRHDLQREIDETPQIVHADASGHFVSRGLAPGVYRLAAAAEGGRTPESLEVRVSIGEARTVELVLSPGRVVQGRCIWRDTNEGVQGASIFASSDSATGLAALPVSSASDGRFVLHGLPNEAVTVHASFPEGGRPAAAALAPTDETVELASSRALGIRGRVVPPTIAKISVVGRPTFLDPDTASLVLGAQLSTMSGEDGEFVLTGVAPGMVRLVADSPEGGVGALTVAVPEGGAEDVVITLAQGIAVSGHVMAGEVAGANLEVIAMRDGEQEITTSAVTDVRGGFSYTGLRAGAYTLAVRDAAGHDVPVTAGGSIVLDTTTAHSITVEVKLPRGEIRGVVLGPDGAPADHAIVALLRNTAGGVVDRSQPEIVAEGLTDDDGGFAFTGLADGEYEIEASPAEGGERASKIGVRPGDRITLSLVATSEIEVRVTGGDGQPIAIVVEGPSPTTSTTTRATSVVSERTAGKYRILARSGTRFGEATVEIAAGERGVAEVALEPGCTIRGTTVGTAISPKLSAVFDGPSWPSHMVPMELGAFEVVGPPDATMVRFQGTPKGVPFRTEVGVRTVACERGGSVSLGEVALTKG